MHTHEHATIPVPDPLDVLAELRARWPLHVELATVTLALSALQSELARVHQVVDDYVKLLAEEREAREAPPVEEDGG